jgi:hypothetical protein
LWVSLISGDDEPESDAIDEERKRLRICRKNEEEREG